MASAPPVPTTAAPLTFTFAVAFAGRTEVVTLPRDVQQPLQEGSRAQHEGALVPNHQVKRAFRLPNIDHHRRDIAQPGHIQRPEIA